MSNEAPFVDHKNSVFTWAQWPTPLPRRVLWRGRYWELQRPVGSTYYLPEQPAQLTLGLLGDDPVQLRPMRKRT